MSFAKDYPDRLPEMHQYLDSDGSGTSPTCVSATIGAERLAAATAWLKANNLKGFLGELGAGSNAQCISAIQGALCSMQQSGVWLGRPFYFLRRADLTTYLGALWWAAGPWWGTVRSLLLIASSARLLTHYCAQYYQSIEPPSGPAIAQILPQALKPFL